ncbi:MAG TPA: HAMP domain-containing sensor histidine kinase [Nitrososphaeraceae archaeon]
MRNSCSDILDDNSKVTNAFPVHQPNDQYASNTSKSEAVQYIHPGYFQNRKSTIDEATRLMMTVDRLENYVDMLKKKNDELNDFVNIEAHEIRSPLMPILGIAEILELEFQETGMDQISIRKDQVESILRNAKKLTKIASEILDVTKIERQLLVLKKKDFDLNRLISDTVADFTKVAVKRNITLLFCNSDDIIRSSFGNLEPNMSDKKIFVFGDLLRIGQVISNILDNALKQTETGGKVTISTCKNLHKGSLRGAEGHEQIEYAIRITDSGPGIDHQLLSDGRLFSKFSSTESNGTGLGLYISRKIVEAHGGNIWAENNSNGGASFTFTVPLQCVS